MEDSTKDSTFVIQSMAGECLVGLLAHATRVPGSTAKDMDRPDISSQVEIAD